jgi:CheY-like chemotaxis protein
MNTEISFLVIDDSELDRFVTQKFLERAKQNVSVKPFHNAEEPLKMILENTGQADTLPTVILLDLKMPVMSGFKFVEEFEKIPAEIQLKYVIIILTMLSSSNDPMDIYKILHFKTVKSVVEKPLTHEKLASILKHLTPGRHKSKD